jgi:hypothetical protein
VDVKAVVEEAVALYADEADEKGIGLEMQEPPELTLTGDRHPSPSGRRESDRERGQVQPTVGGRVEINAAADDPWIRVRVRIPVSDLESDLPLVCDRLYRADASRSARGSASASRWSRPSSKPTAVGWSVLGSRQGSAFTVAACTSVRARTERGNLSKSHLRNAS